MWYGNTGSPGRARVNDKKLGQGSERELVIILFMNEKDFSILIFLYK